MMVDLQNLKNAISGGSFSDDAKKLMIEIIDASIARGSMTAEEKKKLQNIMDVEIDGNALEQSAHEEAAEIIDAFLAEADAIAETASDNIDVLEQEATEESQKIQSDLQSGPQTTSLEPQAVVQETPPQPAEQAQSDQAETPPVQPLQPFPSDPVTPETPAQ